MNGFDGTCLCRYAQRSERSRIPGRRGATLVALTAVCVLVGLLVAAGPARATLLRSELQVAGTAGDNCGASVAISGDTAVVGAPEADPSGKTAAGVAYVFVRSSGVWKLQQKLTAGDGAAGDSFGSAVAASGNTVVIGARYHSPWGVTGAGAAYVFVRSSGVWKLQQKLTAVDADLLDHFGWSVAVSGSTVVVGARDRDTGAKADTGAAYVFVRFGALWATQQILSTPAISAITDDHFGESVAVSGGTALIGVPDGDWLGSPNAGLAYAYTRSGAAWTAAPVLSAVGSGGTGDWFGASVSLSGDTALVGAPGHDVGINANAGAAYLVFRAGGVWDPPEPWFPGGAANSDLSGIAVAISTGAGAIGSIHHVAGAVPDAGGVYPLAKTGKFWAVASSPLSAATPATGDSFGSAVATSGDTIVAGAPDRDTGGLADSGAAFVFQPRPTITKLSPTSARRGAIVTITGLGFGLKRGASYVKFGSAKCTKYVSWSSTHIRCRVPTSAATGSRPVRVVLKSGASNSRSFAVKS